MNRYSEKTPKNPREVVLLKGFPCVWGKCRFCDYISDNGLDEEEINQINEQVLSNVKGTYHALEVINSGNVFELPFKTWQMIKKVIEEKKITKLYFEAHYLYKDRLAELKEFFGVEIIVKLGLETFDDHFRNDVLNKAIHYENIEEIKQSYQSICLLVGIKGQSKEMIEKDIALLLENFDYGCINLYNENSTPFKSDHEIIEWYKKKYGKLEEYPQIDVLYQITDFDVGDDNGESKEEEFDIEGKNINRQRLVWMLKTAIIAAIYVFFCFYFPSYEVIQFRFSEVLVLLVFFNKRYSYALILGCFIANLFSPFAHIDIFVGTFATVLTCLCVSKCKHLLIASLIPTLFCVFVGLELYFLFGGSLFLVTLYVMIGEFIVVTIIGYPLFLYLSHNKGFMKLIQSEKIFK